MAETSRVYGRSRHAPPQAQSAQLTVRGAVTTLLISTLIGTLIGEHFELTWLTGMLFIIGSLAVTGLIRREDLHLIVVAPPLVYFVSLLVVDSVLSFGSGFLRGLLVSVATNLSAIAPWLIVGTLGAVALAWYRGLPAAYAALRARVRGEDLAAQQPAARRGAADPQWQPPRPVPEPAAQPAPPQPRPAEPTARYAAAPTYAPAQPPMAPRYTNAPDGYRRQAGPRHGY